MYVRIACATTLIKISLPLIESIFSFHPESFFPTFSFISTKTWFFDFPIIEERLRYLPCLMSYIGPRMPKSSFLVSGVVFWLTNTEDLFVLIFYPNAISYRSRFSTNVWLSCLSALQNNRLSSMKNKWVILGLPLHMDMPLSP